MGNKSFAQIFSFGFLAILFIPFISCNSKKADDSINMPVTIAGSPVRGIVPVCSVVRTNAESASVDPRQQKATCSAVNRTDSGDKPIEHPENYSFQWTNPKLVSGISFEASGCKEQSDGLVNECQFIFASTGPSFVEFSLTATPKDGSKPETNHDTIMFPFSARSIGSVLAAGRRHIPGVAEMGSQQRSARNAISSLDNASNAPGISLLTLPFDKAIVPIGFQNTSKVCEMDGTLYLMSRTHLYAVENGMARRLAGNDLAPFPPTLEEMTSHPDNVNLSGRTAIVCNPAKNKNEVSSLLVFGANPSKEKNRPWMIKYSNDGTASFQFINDSPELSALPSITGAVKGSDGAIYLLDMTSDPLAANTTAGVLSSPRVLKYFSGKLRMFNKVPLRSSGNTSGAASNQLTGGIAIDSIGNIFVSSTYLQTIWRISKSGDPCVVVGESLNNEIGKCSDAPQPPRDSEFDYPNNPSGLTVLEDDSLLVLSNKNLGGVFIGSVYRIKGNQINLFYEARNTDLPLPSPASSIKTIAFLPDRTNIPNLLSYNTSISRTNDGGLYIANNSGYFIKLRHNGIHATALETLSFGIQSTVDSKIELKVDALTQIGDARDMEFDSKSNLVVAEGFGNRILRFREDNDGKIWVKTLAGTRNGAAPPETPTTPPNDILLGQISSIKVGNLDIIYISESGERFNHNITDDGIRIGRLNPPNREFPNGRYEIIAGGKGRGIYSRDSIGNIGSTGSDRIFRNLNNPDPKEIRLNSPAGLDLDSSQNVYFAERYAGYVIKLKPRDAHQYESSLYFDTDTIFREAQIQGFKGTPQIGALANWDDTQLVLGTVIGHGSGIYLIHPNGTFKRVAGTRYNQTTQRAEKVGQIRPALELSIVPYSIKRDSPGRLLVNDNNQRVIRLNYDSSKDMFFGEVVYDRQNQVADCGLIDVVGTAHNNEDALMMSLNKFCVPNIISIASKNKCSQGAPVAHLALGVSWDPNNATGTMVHAQFSCPPAQHQ